MAGFRKDETGVAQTAANSASTVIAAAVAAGILKTEAAIKKAFDTHYTNVFTALSEVVQKDNEMFEKLDAQEAAKPAKSGGNRSTGGSKGGSGGTVSVDDALGTTFNFGAFKDLTIGEVLDMDAEATSDYGYDKGGKAYITWLAKSRDNAFMAKRAKVVLDAARSGSDS